MNPETELGRQRNVAVEIVISLREQGAGNWVKEKKGNLDPISFFTVNGKGYYIAHVKQSTFQRLVERIQTRHNLT